jgi:hypothetical protein
MSGVKPFLIICAFAGLALGIGGSCGPQRSFCPNNPPEYNCITNSEAGSMGGAGGMADMCDGGLHTVRDGVVVCI